MADKVNVTVRKNWKKKIEALCEGVDTFTSFSLQSDFVGVDIKTYDMLSFVNKELESSYTKLTYNKVSGVCCIHVHSNLWFNWTKKIDW